MQTRSMSKASRRNDKPVLDTAPSGGVGTAPTSHIPSDGLKASVASDVVASPPSAESCTASTTAITSPRIPALLSLEKLESSIPGGVSITNLVTDSRYLQVPESTSVSQCSLLPQDSVLPMRSLRIPQEKNCTNGHLSSTHIGQPRST